MTISTKKTITNAPGLVSRNSHSFRFVCPGCALRQGLALDYVTNHGNY